MSRLAAALLAFLFSSSLALACGTERWPVKTGADHNAARVVLAPEASTIAALVALPAPKAPDRLESTRFSAELRTYRIDGTIALVKREADHDYHIVITDDAGHHMIVEAPDPACARRSRFLTQLRDVRATIDAVLGPVGARKLHPKIAATVTGILFFDPVHGQEGVAPNGVELHPVLSITLPGARAPRPRR